MLSTKLPPCKHDLDSADRVNQRSVCLHDVSTTSWIVKWGSDGDSLRSIYEIMCHCLPCYSSRSSTYLAHSCQSDIVNHTTKILKTVRPPASAGVPPSLRRRLPFTYIYCMDLWPGKELSLFSEAYSYFGAHAAENCFQKAVTARSTVA